MVGRFARVPLTNFKEYIISLDVAKIVPLKLSKEYLYASLKFNYYGDSLKEFANGTNVLHLNPNLLNKEFLLLPSKEIIDAFSKQVKPLFELCDLYAIQNSVLLKIRDRLLPRLIGGKLQLKSDKSTEVGALQD